MLETGLQLESDPPVTETSYSKKLKDVSERVKVRVAVSPALRKLSASSSVMAIVGGVVSGGAGGVGEGDGVGVVVVSTVKVTELLASEPSRLLLPAASENFELATEITPSVVLLTVGVKVAV